MTKTEYYRLLNEAENMLKRGSGKILREDQKRFDEIAELTDNETVEGFQHNPYQVRQNGILQYDPVTDDAPPESCGGVQHTEPRAHAVRKLKQNERLTEQRDRHRDIEKYGVPADQLSVGLFLRGAVTGNWDGAEAERRAQVESSTVAGGIVVPTALATNVIDLARDASVVLSAGASTINMETPELLIARQTGDITPAWYGEGVEIATSDMSFDGVTLRAKKLAARCQVSLELVEDARNIGALIDSSISTALGAELDRVALYGTGAEGEPLGLINADGISTVDISSAALADYSPFSKGWAKVLTANGSPDGMACIVAPRVLGELDLLEDTTGQPLQPPASWAKLAKYVSGKVRTTITASDTEAFIGHFNQLAIGMRTDLVVEVSAVADDAWKKGMLDFRAYLRADVALLQPSWLCHVQNIGQAS